jgi:hypothetical protein
MDAKGPWEPRWRTYTDYVNAQDRRLTVSARAGTSVFVRLLKTSSFAVWCADRKVAPTFEALENYTAEDAHMYPYDGNLWYLIRMHQITSELVQAIRKTRDENVSSALEQLETPFCDLMSRTIIQAAGSDGQIVITAYQDQESHADHPETYTVELPLAGGRWVENPPSRFLLARVCALLSQINGGQIDLHLYQTNGPLVFSCTYWLPWGQGKVGTQTGPT